MTASSFQKIKKGTVTTPQGFNASGMHCGIKKRKKAYDCSLIFSKTPCVAAGTFTVNKVKAWPVLCSEKVIAHPRHRAILASSGNANCVNGPKGKAAAQTAIHDLSRELEISEKEILLAQTGLIGVPFPITRFKRGISKLVKKLSPSGGRHAARGILTTDRKTKEIAVSFRLGGKQMRVGALSKGAGMVHPHMATMLCFITTDAAITKRMLSKALVEAVGQTFNQMAIDNDMSTNDTVFALANGLAKNATIRSQNKNYQIFKEALTFICRDMAYKMIEDGEGVRHICTLKLRGAKNIKQAHAAARQIANSMLFKTMLAGADPNWGRIVAAVGASRVAYDIDHFNISFDKVPVLKNGRLCALNLPKARRVLQKKTYRIDVMIGRGRAETEFVTSDLTTDYVEINSAYS